MTVVVNITPLSRFKRRRLSVAFSLNVAARCVCFAQILTAGAESPEPQKNATSQASSHFEVFEPSFAISWITRTQDRKLQYSALTREVCR
jgi:hypothetical protein